MSLQHYQGVISTILPQNDVWDVILAIFWTEDSHKTLSLVCKAFGRIMTSRGFIERVQSRIRYAPTMDFLQYLIRYDRLTTDIVNGSIAHILRQTRGINLINESNYLLSYDVVITDRGMTRGALYLHTLMSKEELISNEKLADIFANDDGNTYDAWLFIRDLVSHVPEGSQCKKREELLPATSSWEYLSTNMETWREGRFLTTAIPPLSLVPDLIRRVSEIFTEEDAFDDAYHWETPFWYMWLSGASVVHDFIADEHHRPMEIMCAFVERERRAYLNRHDLGFAALCLFGSHENELIRRDQRGIPLDEEDFRATERYMIDVFISSKTIPPIPPWIEIGNISRETLTRFLCCTGGHAWINMAAEWAQNRYYDDERDIEIPLDVYLPLIKTPSQLIDALSGGYGWKVIGKNSGDIYDIDVDDMEIVQRAVETHPLFGYLSLQDFERYLTFSVKKKIADIEKLVLSRRGTMYQVKDLLLISSVNGDYRSHIIRDKAVNLSLQNMYRRRLPQLDIIKWFLVHRPEYIDITTAEMESYRPSSHTEVRIQLQDERKRGGIVTK